MRVKIIKCTEQEIEEEIRPYYTGVWYKDKIGQVFEVDERYKEDAEMEFQMPSDRVVTTIDGQPYAIYKADCVIVYEYLPPNEIRCRECNRKLAEFTGDIQWISIKCHNCKSISVSKFNSK